MSQKEQLSEVLAARLDVRAKRRRLDKPETTGRRNDLDELLDDLAKQGRLPFKDDAGNEPGKNAG